jgi:DNA repair protein RecO (recombination protein O)
MEWRDEGILLTSRRHGESAAIIEAFTSAHGRHAGMVRGGAGRRMTPVLQPGAILSLDWSARLEEHLGAFRVDPIRSNTAHLMADRAALAALGSITSLISAALPEREANPSLYARTLDLVDALGRTPNWPARYALWEIALLSEIGFGLDLSRCAANGTTDDLIYVSPKSGCAVSRAGGAPWADRLLPLPAFLRDGAGAEPACPEQITQALRLTGHFLEARLAPTLPRETLPPARARAVEAILRQTAQAQS